MSAPTPTAVSASSTSSSSPIQLNQNDVIVKPGPSDNSHPGNIAFQRIVNLNKGSFKTASDKSERLRIAKTIVQTINNESKGRFLERNADNTEGWKEVDNREATKMAIFALRGVSVAPVSVKVEVIDVTDDNHEIKEEFVDEETYDTPSVAKPAKALESSTKSSPQAMQQKICMAQLIKLGADQMSFSKYPVGCQVHYSSNTQELSVTSQPDVKFIASVRRGKVNNVFMDLGSKQFVYEVVPTSSNVEDKELLTEAQLTYATGTPVNVQFSLTESTYDGEIIGYKVEEKKTYTIIIFTKDSSAQIFDDVASDYITYRLVKENNGIDSNSNTSKNTQELSSLGEDKMEEVSKATSKSVTHNDDTPPIEMVTKKRASASPTTSSITHDDNGANGLSARPAKLLKGGNEFVENVLTLKSIHPSHTSNQTPSTKTFPTHPVQAELSKSRNINTIHPLRAGMHKPLHYDTDSSNETLVIKIPLWLQDTKELRLDLFHHLMGEDPAMETGYKLKNLSFQTNCLIAVRGPEFGSKAQREICPVMQVTVSKKHGNSPPSDQTRAKAVIMDSLIEFVGNDGSRAKLCYDLASSSEDNICRGSKYNAVFAPNPFSKTNQRVCMALFALPYKPIPLQNGGNMKNYHGGFLLKGQNTSRINRCKCTMVLCGDSYNVPTKLCDPYGVVFGGNVSDVHNAMDNVTKCIAKHRHTCSCIFS
eukprot:scaffold8842_cov74-Cyclotella_meneghiniana.AAC.7